MFAPVLSVLWYIRAYDIILIMLIDNEMAHSLAEQQALLGLELAFQANDAYGHAIALAASRRAVLDAGSGRADWYEAVFLPQEEVRVEIQAYEARHMGLRNAAGALLGRYTLGGEFISVQNGNDPVLYNDGSYVSGSAQ